jgi:hypothetical protein
MRFPDARSQESVSAFDSLLEQTKGGSHGCRGPLSDQPGTDDEESSWRVCLEILSVVLPRHPWELSVSGMIERRPTKESKAKK